VHSTHRRGIWVALALAIAAFGCTGGDDLEGDQHAANHDGGEAEPSDPDDAQGEAQGDGEDETQGDEQDAEDGAGGSSQTTLERETLETPRTEAEIRVGEIILEFEGQVTDDGTVLTIEEPILFDFDSAVLRPGAGDALDDIAEVLAFYPDAPVQVLGHTDDVGSDAYNLDLSQRRADAVTDALVDRGVSSDRMTSEGRGLREPVASNDTDQGRAQNRRVEVLIVGVEPPS
jgi:outer membrane protein OmpA-like peptidoglycan-associated protein